MTLAESPTSTCKVLPYPGSHGGPGDAAVQTAQLLQNFGVYDAFEPAAYATLMPDFVHFDATSGHFTLVGSAGDSGDSSWSAAGSGWTIETVRITEIHTREDGVLRASAVFDEHFEVRLTFEAIGQNGFLLTVEPAEVAGGSLGSLQLTVLIEPRVGVSAAADRTRAGIEPVEPNSGRLGRNEAPVVAQVDYEFRVCRDELGAFAAGEVCRCEDGRSGVEVCTGSRCHTLSGCLGGQQHLRCNWYPAPQPTGNGSWGIVAIPVVLGAVARFRKRWS